MHSPFFRKIVPVSLVIEERNPLTCKTSKNVSREPLASILALNICFSTKEMEIVVENEFAEVFVPLLTALASYSGVSNVAKSTKSNKNGQSLVSNLSPFQAALNCLQVITFCVYLEPLQCLLN